MHHDEPSGSRPFPGATGASIRRHAPSQASPTPARPLPDLSSGEAPYDETLLGMGALRPSIPREAPSTETLEPDFDDEPTSTVRLSQLPDLSLSDDEGDVSLGTLLGVDHPRALPDDETLELAVAWTLRTAAR